MIKSTRKNPPSYAKLNAGDSGPSLEGEGEVRGDAAPRHPGSIAAVLLVLAVVCCCRHRRSWSWSSSVAVVVPVIVSWRGWGVVGDPVRLRVSKNIHVSCVNRGDREL